MKHEYKQGWYRVREIIGQKWEVTYFDGSHTHCEDIRVDGGYGAASSFCKGRIDAARAA